MKLTCKVERLNVKQRRSWRDGSYEPSRPDLRCLQSLLLSPVAVKELLLFNHLPEKGSIPTKTIFLPVEAIFFFF